MNPPQTPPSRTRANPNTGSFGVAQTGNNSAPPKTATVSFSGDRYERPFKQFPTDVTGLPQATELKAIDLSSASPFDFRIAPVAKRLGNTTVRMLAYNGSVPGPTIPVQQGSEVVVRAVNEGDPEATVHWHGLRLDNEYDGILP